jgi:P-type Cu+ transporter
MLIYFCTMQKVAWKVEGMTCSNCALTVSKFLQKQGMQEVNVNPIDGNVSFTAVGELPAVALQKGIEDLGYKMAGTTETEIKKRFLPNYKSRFFFCLWFTIPLLAHMLPWHIHFLMNPLVQLALTLPVFIVGMYFFGKSAVKSLQNGMANMNVLITLGALAAFIYSLTGTLLQLGPAYQFYETTASIITLVFLGNYLEEASLQSTQRAIKSLAKSQVVMANMIAFDDQHQEQVFPVENKTLRVGDLILIKTGEQVPADCKILWGECTVSEAIITGESKPLFRQKKELLIGGSHLENGTVKAQVTATGNDTVLSGILQMVAAAQGEKPPLQKLADKISAVFVPLVVGIAILTFFINYFGFDISGGNSLLRAIAVLVISCPCAMGLATPAAIAVGLGRGAKNGILYKNAAALEGFKKIKQLVFDKTGTLTTGSFSIQQYQAAGVEEAEFKRIVFSLEKYSNHPVAKCMATAWKTTNEVKWKKVEEIKGLGMRAVDADGNVFEAGSYKLIAGKTTDTDHNIYVLKNSELLGWVDVADEIRPEAAGVIKWLHSKGINTILLSGDKQGNCEQVATQLGIETVVAEQTPAQKLDYLDALVKQQPTAMVGDGINDAPALAKATLGISLSEASQIAMQSADVILMNHGLKNLPQALGLGNHTYITIKQNLFWAFFYNIVAIPIAAFGLLTPTLAALAMGLSDVVLGINSVRLFVKKVV